MDKLINIETKLKFYNQQKLSGLRVFWLRLIAKYYRYKLVKFAIHQTNTFTNILSKLGFMQNKTSVQFTEVRDI